MTRVWMMSELYYPEETSTGYVVTRIAEGIARERPVGVICAQPTYSARGLNASKRERRNGTDIHRVWSTRFDKNVPSLRIINSLTITLMMFLRAVRVLRRGDVAFAVTNPPPLPFVIALACKLRRARFVVVVHDVYPDALVAAGMLSADSPSARILDRLTRIMYRQADRVIVLGRDMRERILAKLGAGHDERVVVITNWSDTKRIHRHPRPGSPLLEQLGLADKFVVQFAGNIGPLQNIPFLLDVAEALRVDGRVHFLFVGSGGRRAFLESEVDRRQLSNVTVLDWVPRDQAAEMHRASDAVVISLVAGMEGVSVPSRLYNALASGRPIIAACDPGSEVATVVREEGAGWVVRPGDVEAFLRVIAEALSNPEVVEGMGIRSRHAAETRYDEDLVIGGFLDIVERTGVR